MVRAVVAGLEVPGEVQHGVRVELHQPLDEQVGLVLGVALGGLAGAVDDLPELRLVHHGTSIVVLARRAPRTRSRRNAESFDVLTNGGQKMSGIRATVGVMTTDTEART